MLNQFIKGLCGGRGVCGPTRQDLAPVAIAIPNGMNLWHCVMSRPMEMIMEEGADSFNVLRTGFGNHIVAFRG